MISRQTIYIVIGFVIACAWVVSAHPQQHQQVDPYRIPWSAPSVHDPRESWERHGLYDDPARQRDYRRSEDRRMQERRDKELNEWRREISDGYHIDRRYSD